MALKGLLLFLLLVMGGAFLEAVLAKLYRQFLGKKYKKYHFSFSKYIYLLLMPIVGVIVAFYLDGVSIIKAFLLFAVMGTFFEWVIGYAYYSIVGQKLWTYHRYTLSGYTSVLSVPFWGLGGVLFYFLAQIIQ